MIERGDIGPPALSLRELTQLKSDKVTKVARKGASP
jgi:hypothetical protein